MAKNVSNFTKKFNYTGSGYIDAKLGPFKNLDDVKKSISVLELTEGLSAVVLDDGTGVPADFWYIGGQWVKKDSSKIKEDVNNVKKDVERLRTDVDNNTLYLEQNEQAVNAINASLADDGKIGKAIKEASTTASNANSVAKQAATDASNAKTEVASLSSRIETIAGKVDTNENSIKTLSSTIDKIAGIDKLKAGKNISITDNPDGTRTISATIPDVGDLGQLDSRVTNLEASQRNQDTRIDKVEQDIKDFSSSGSNLAIDNNSLEYIDGGTRLSVKVADKKTVVNNMLSETTDGLSVIIPLDGNDCDTEI